MNERKSNKWILHKQLITSKIVTKAEHQPKSKGIFYFFKIRESWKDEYEQYAIETKTENETAISIYNINYRWNDGNAEFC